METRYLKTLVAVVETGSFSRAAEALNITQSAVSQRIKFLEERFGHQLLDRSGPLLVPTEAGRLALEKAREILVKEQELREELARLGGKKRLSLCCTPTFGMAYLPGVLNDFIPRHADLADLKFIFQQPEQALRGLLQNEFDLSVIEHCDDLDFSPFHALPLPRDELVFISAPTLGLSSSQIELAELLPQRLYARRDGCSSKQLLQLNLGGLGSSLDNFRSVVVSDDLRLTIQSVLTGSGISFISRSLAATHLERGELRAHHVRGFSHFRSRSAVLPKGRAEDPVLLNFLDCVQATFAPPGAEVA